MSTGEPPAPPAPSPAPPPEQTGGRKKVWVLVIVAVIVVAALAGVAYILLSQPTTQPPAGPTLDRVVVTASSTAPMYPGSSVILTATAYDTNNKDETQNATFAWAKSSSAVTLASAGSKNAQKVNATRDGVATVYANATLNSVTKSGSYVSTVNLLTYRIASSNSHPLVPPVVNVSEVSLTLTVLTPSNTPYVNYSGTVNFTSTDPAAKLPVNFTFNSAFKGVYTFPNVVITLPGDVTITARDARYPVITGSVVLTGNRAPTGQFTVTGNAADPRIITVDATGSSDPDAGQTASLTYTWAFGDAGTGSGITASHTYATANVYTIGLTVSDVWAASNTTYKQYTAHSPPTAAFDIESQAPNGASVLVWANASKSLGGDGLIAYYNWTWGDGNYSQVTSALAAHNYTSYFNGKTLTLILRVVNSYSLTDSISKSVLVTTVKQPPIAKFTYSFTVGPIVNRVALRTLDVDATQSFSPVGTALLYFNWTWGDGSYTNSSNKIVSHVYPTDGSYVVNLTVIDADMLKGYNQTTIAITVPASPPVALFDLTTNKLSVHVDANASWDPNNNIAYYNWTWGNAGNSFMNSTNPWAQFTYGTAGIYTVTLTVIDTTGKKGIVSHQASVAATTLDYSFYDFFNVSYGEWWDLRLPGGYGDKPVNANCFNATSIQDGVCSGTANPALPATESYPYTDWYPAPFGSLSYRQPGNDPFLYAPYRMHVVGVSVPGYNLSQPVFLPTLNYNAARGSRLSFQWDMQYLDIKQSNALTAAGCAGVQSKFNDGFYLRSVVTLTMDAQEARRMFGMPSSATTQAQINAWIAANTNAACSATTFENSISNWYAGVGNGKYDIYNEYQYAYTPFYTNVSATVDPDTTMHVHIDMSAWGTEALIARMFYWGNASYVGNYFNSQHARGWYGMEVPWFEDFHFAGNLDSAAMNFTLTTVLQYHFQAGSSPGPDGTYHTGTNNDVDDVPFWTWGPWLADYVASSAQHPYSELDRWAGLTYAHSTPGAGNYGAQGQYDYAPLSWAAKYGESWHFVFPNVMRFYNPNTSPIPSNPIGDLTYYPNSQGASGVNYVMWKTNPANYGTYDNALWTWDVYGNVSALPPSWPQQTGSGTYPLLPWGGIFLVPQGSSPGLVQPAVVTVAASAAVVTSSSSLNLGVPVVLSPVLAWVATLIAIPAALGAFFLRE